MKRPEKLKVIIWDCDGTLRSASWEGLYLAYTELIKAKGKAPSQFYTDMHTFKSWFNLDWHKNIETIDGTPYVEDPALNKLFHRHYDPHVKIFPWVKGLMRHLSTKCPQAVLSSSSVDSIKKELVSVSQFFDTNLIVGAETVKKLKPHPEGVLYILNYLNVAPEHALIIGDTPLDFYAGASAGVRTGMVGWGLCSLDELYPLGAEMYFEHPSDLFFL